MFSFGIIAEKFEVFEKDIFDCKVLGVGVKGEWNFVGFLVRSLVRFLGAMFACGFSGVRVAAFFEKLAQFLAFVG